eukprot:GILJ01014294.1.p2 GENE.GILJ01014294.1~~GILJ01014294.1.p2  ORF type:complete len:116 (+),score=15.45 GILJ01014294.1:206-553(+)
MALVGPPLPLVEISSSRNSLNMTRAHCTDDRAASRFFKMDKLSLAPSAALKHRIKSSSKEKVRKNVASVTGSRRRNSFGLGSKSGSLVQIVQEHSLRHDGHFHSGVVITLRISSL